MIRIIEEKPDPSVMKQIICRQCGVKLEYAPVDVKKYEGMDYSGGPDGCTWIDCSKGMMDPYGIHTQILSKK